ncbi:MAG: hypothetical protein K1X78_25360 [Verrucomicrobiaceae bacterium]|nr:hypothetical protein [Verrucomicrobiaceae bacterium]
MKSLGTPFERRPGFARCCIRVIPVLAAFFVLSALSVRADQPKGKPGKEKSKADALEKDGAKGEKGAKETKSETANAGLQSFGQMIPLGSRSRGVRLPAYENGKPSSLIVADAMTRVDDNRLFSEKMTIHVYAEKKEEDMRIDLKTGTYNMENQILSSTERSRVSRSDFQIEGDSMVYDTKTAQGKMTGNVEMIIFDAEQARQKMGVNAGAKPPPTPAAPETPEGDTEKKKTNPEPKK